LPVPRSQGVMTCPRGRRRKANNAAARAEYS
jgi:hypothetical protein